MGELRKKHKILVRERLTPGRPRNRWEDNIKMDLKEIGSKCGLHSFGIG
jgi:hypothetical protein